jgi:hypothetical protein
MTLSGWRGAVQINGRDAAVLGRWRCDKTKDSPRLAVHAELVSKDDFLLERGNGNLELVLDIQKTKRRRVIDYVIAGNEITVRAEANCL